MFPSKSSIESHSHQKLSPKRREVLIKMRMKPHDHPFQRQVQLSTRNIVEVHITHFGKPVAYRYVILFQESWKIRTCTGSQEVQKLWWTEAIFHHKNFSSLIFFSNKSACDFGLSGEPRIISSSLFGVLISWQSFQEDA